jgi:hypothetical protein
MAEELLRVECYSGYRGGERPARLHLRGYAVHVVDVEDRWYSPGYTYFRVLLDNGERYVLRHVEAQDVWTIEAFRAPRRYIDTKINGGV